MRSSVPPRGSGGLTLQIKTHNGMSSVPSRGRDYVKPVGGCPRLVRGRFTLAARNEQQSTFEDATALRGGVSRWLLEMNSNRLLKMPPPCAVESHVGC